MNPAFVGDSYDLVKRFFTKELILLGYEVAIDPMYTGDWNGMKEEFLQLVGVNTPQMEADKFSRRALFLDPDTGVNHKGGKQHVAFVRIAHETRAYDLVFAFDQSFSRQAKPREAMRAKLEQLQNFGIQGMYYDSHARFLFASKRSDELNELREHLVQLGMPASRMLLSGE